MKPKTKIEYVWEDPKPPERVMLVDEYDKVLAAEQQNTMVQSGLVMIDMQKEALKNQRKMLEKQDQTIGAIDKLDVNVNINTEKSLRTWRKFSKR